VPRRDAIASLKTDAAKLDLKMAGEAMCADCHRTTGTTTTTPITERVQTGRRGRAGCWNCHPAHHHAAIETIPRPPQRRQTFDDMQHGDGCHAQHVKTSRTSSIRPRPSSTSKKACGTKPSRELLRLLPEASRVDDEERASTHHHHGRRSRLQPPSWYCSRILWGVERRVAIGRARGGAQPRRARRVIRASARP